MALRKNEDWREELLALWERALRVEIGIAVSTDNRNLLKNQLYECRSDLGEGKYDNLSIYVPDSGPTNPGGELFILRKEFVDASIRR